VFNEACYSAENPLENIEKELRAYNSTFIAVTHVEKVDLPFLIKNETEFRLEEIAKNP